VPIPDDYKSLWALVILMRSALSNLIISMAVHTHLVCPVESFHARGPTSQERPGEVEPGRFILTPLVPKRITQEARRFSSSGFC
jgi:hypothetical protein